MPKLSILHKRVPGEHCTASCTDCHDPHTNDGFGADELWSGFINIAQPDPEDSATCMWMSQPGGEMASENQLSHIGDNPNHNDIPGDQNNQLFKGLIDWVVWKPFADYYGVDDPPH